VVNFENLPEQTQIFVGVISLLTLFFHVRYNDQSINHGPTILTTTGIFATFVGIAIGLSGLNAADIEHSVPALLDGLRTAFWGSIAGVGGALTIKFRQLMFGNPATATGSGDEGQVTAEDLAKLLQNIQLALVGGDDSTLITQLKLARQENNDRLDALKKAQIEALEKLSELGSKALIEALKDVISDFNQKLTEQFGENFKHLNEAVAKLVVWQQQYKEQMEATTTQLITITAATKESATRYEQLVGKAEVFTKVSNDLSVLLNGLETQRKELTAALQMLGELLTKASDSLPQIGKRVTEFTDQMTSAVFKNQTELNKALTENAARIRTSIDSSAKDISKMNADMARELSGMVAKAKEQVSILDKTLAEELQKSLESLGRQLAALSEKFVSDYGPLTDRLRQLVQIAGRVQ
jgi:ABC-type transporter Mla subunit MlaD